MNVYLVDYWVPFPASEYGGLFAVIAKDTEQCAKLLTEAHSVSKEHVPDLVFSINKAPVLQLAGKHKAGIIAEFYT